MAGERRPNFVLIELRESRGLSQQELAVELNRLATTKYNRETNLTKKSVWRWEGGDTVKPKGIYQLLLSDFFDVPTGELGFLRTHHEPVPASGTAEPAGPCSDPEVDREQHEWRETRTSLGRTRRALALVAEQLYPDYSVPGLEGCGVIAHPDWIPPAPVALDQVVLRLDPDLAPATVTGGEPEAASVRPWCAPGVRYRRYHDAIRDLASPRLFENRLCFRLASLDWTGNSMRFGHMGFFDAMDVNEALAHETAEEHLARDHDGRLVTTRPSWRNLRFRSRVGDPFDLRRRPLMGAVGTLTIRGGDSPSVVLHHRDGSRVAGGGGMTHLLPAGIFQPSSVLPAAISADFSLWRNIQREFAEELLGHDEYDGSGQPIAYDSLEPFATMDRAFAEERIRVWCLGVTLDALTLAGDILTVAVIEPDIYDTLFGAAVESNTEGAVPSRALPFEGNTLRHLREDGTLSPGAAAALHLAWTHRALLLHGGRETPVA